jgi:dihydropteroate synthase
LSWRHFRPVGFIDSPTISGSQVARLAGSKLYFTHYEIGEAGQAALRLVPVSSIAAELRNETEALTIKRIIAPRPPVALTQGALRFDQPSVVGIVSVKARASTNGPTHAQLDAAVARGIDMAAVGAVLVDVDGDTTPPGAGPVWQGDERARVVPIVAALAAAGVAVSIKTRNASVMDAALKGGAVIVHDVSAVMDDREVWPLLQGATCPIIIRHWTNKGRSRRGPGRDDGVAPQTYEWLKIRADVIEEHGISRSRLIVDPGIGHSGSVADDLALLNNLALFHGLGCPIMVDAPCVRLIGDSARETSADQSAAVAVHAANQGVQLLRVHDVAATVQALRVRRDSRNQALVRD